MKVFIALFLISAGCSHGPMSKKAQKQLESWNDFGVKQSILDWVSKITKEDGANYIPEEDRIAVFDNDGTLWAENPIAEIMFSEKIAQDRGIQHKPFQQMNEKEIKIFFVDTHTGMTKEEFNNEAKKFFKTARHPKFNVPFSKTVYQPQLEVLKLLRKHGFKIYIVSGGTSEFMREFSKSFYGVPVEQVIGSSFKNKYDAETNVMTTTKEIDVLNDKINKAYEIEKIIGKRPVFAAGNVRSGGDVYMLRYSQGSKYLTYQMMINHNDPDREFSYEEKDGTSLLWARKYEWNIVNIKDDWKQIFPK